VTSDKIADGNVGTVELADSSVTTPKIADGAVTGEKISGITKLIFAECTVDDIDFGGGQSVTIFCTFPGVEVGDNILITAQEILNNFGAVSACPVVSQAQAFQDVVRIHLTAAICTPAAGTLWEATFAIAAFRL
jgi:hypothetical protein